MKNFNFLKKMANTPPCGFRGASRVLGLVLVLLTIGVGQVWGEDASISSFSATSGNIVSGVITYSSTKVSTNGPEVSGTQLKLYRKGKSGGLGDYVTVAAVSPAKITSITFTLSASTGYSYQVDAATAVTGNNSSIAISSINASSVKFQNNSTSQMFVTGISLTYSTGSSKTLSSISVSTAPTKKKYVAGETFDPTGLVIRRNYSDDTNDTYAYAGHTSDFTFSPTTLTALTTSNTSVSITYGGKSTSQAINVYNVTMQARDEDGNTIPAGGPGAPSRTGKSISPAADANNYVFKEWSISGASLGSSKTTKSNTITNPTGAVTVTAVYYKPITITYKANGETFTTQTYGYGGTLAFPASEPDGDDYSCTGKTFTGWVAEASKDYKHASTAPTYVTAGGSVTTGATYYAVFATATSGGSDVTDEINNSVTTSKLGSSSTSSWVSVWETSAMTSGAKYKIYSMGINGASDYALQWNSSGYLYCSSAPSSGRKLKSITIKTKATKSIGIYGSTSVYSAKASATSLNTLSATTSGATYSLTSEQLANNYTCVGINGTASSTQVVSISITYSAGVSYSNYETNCCTPLGSVSGTITSNSPTNLTLSWSAVTGAEKYQVKVPGSSSHNGWTDVNATSVTITKSCGTAYTAYFKAVDTNGSHCSEGPESTLTIPAQSWTVTSTGVTNVTASPAIPSTTCSGFNTTITAATGYALPSEITVTNADKTWNSSTGALAISNVTGNVTITIAGTCVAPDITVHPASANYVAYPVAAFELLDSLQVWFVNTTRYCVTPAVVREGV